MMLYSHLGVECSRYLQCVFAILEIGVYGLGLQFTQLAASHKSKANPHLVTSDKEVQELRAASNQGLVATFSLIFSFFH